MVGKGQEKYSEDTIRRYLATQERPVPLRLAVANALESKAWDICYRQEETLAVTFAELESSDVLMKVASNSVERIFC
jgi:hypothetical protein